MNPQAVTEDRPKDAIDNSGWNWTMEKKVGESFRPYPRFNDTADASYSKDDKNTENSTQGPAISVTSSLFDTSSAPASDGDDGERATPENDPAQTSTNAWHMTTHITSEGDVQTSFCMVAPFGTQQQENIMLMVELDEASKHYTLTPCFPARHERSTALWADPATVSDALTQIEDIITKINPSVCFSVKTKALENHDTEARAAWHVMALNTLATSLASQVRVAFGDYPVRFGQAPANSTIDPGSYYPTRGEVIKPPGLRQVLRKDQADRMFDKLPIDHPCYCQLKTQGTGQGYSWDLEVRS